MGTLIKLSLHLQHWGKAKISYPLTEESVLCVRADAPLAEPSLHSDFAKAFGARPTLSVLRALELFSSPQRFGELLRTTSERFSSRRLVQIAAFLLQRGYLEQLHSYIYCVSEPPPPPSGAPPRSLALWRLFWQLRPLLYGEHPIEEIVWQAEIERDAVAELIDAYEEHLVCVVMPGDACSHSVT